MKFIFSLLLFTVFGQAASAKLIVAATTTDLAGLVRTVGKDHVEVFSVAKGTQDPHQIEAKPSFMVKFRDADLVVAHGLDLESAWLTPLINGARNSKIKPGSPGFLELGQDLQPIEVSGSATRAEGDVHPGGNPHFQLDPVRMGQAAILVAKRLAEMDPANAKAYLDQASIFSKTMQAKAKEWQTRLSKAGIKEVVTYHKTFSYFLDRFGIASPLQLEPKPGIPPTAAHIVDVVNQMKSRGIRLVLIENYFDAAIRKKLETEIADVKVRVVPVSVEGLPSIMTSEELIDYLVKTFEEAK